LVFPSRLYAILDRELTLARGLAPLDVVDAWLDAGVRVIQLRAKETASGEFLRLADEVARRSKAMGALFIVNDRADIAVMADAAGVHLGQDDLRPEDARRVVGARVIGLSTHNDVQLTRALDAPVDYVAIGPVFETQSKARPDPVVGLEGVSMAASRARPRACPVVAIGGITLPRAADVLAAGASAIAVISDLLSGDITARARAWLEATNS